MRHPTFGLALGLVALAALPLVTPTRRAAAAEGPLSAAARAVLEGADSVEVVSLDPNVHRGWGYGHEGTLAPTPLEAWLTALAEREGVHGRVALPDPAARKALVAQAVAGLSPPPQPSAGCYDPRHALVARKGTETVVIQMCFACSYAVVLDRATTKGSEQPFGDPGGLQARLDELLEAAGVPLARKLEAGPPVPPLDRAAVDKVVPEDVRRVLAAPETVTLYGIDPDVYRSVSRGEPEGTKPPLETAVASLLGGAGVTQQVKLTRPGSRTALLDGLQRGLLEPGAPAECYNPRHAVVVTRGAARAAFFLCFECSYATVIGAGLPRAIGLQAFGDVGRFQERLDGILAAAAPRPTKQPESPPR